MHALRLLWAAHLEESWLRRKRRLNRRKIETIEKLPETFFIERFGLDKETFWQLCGDLRRLTTLKGTREISLEIKVLCALSFFATGSYQRVVGITQHLTQRTASRCIRQVTDALNHVSIMRSWIVFPQSLQERSSVKLKFERRFQLPGVIGCIDCTHVALMRPSEEEHIFINRKGYYSLNVQMICDSDLRIINVNAKFGGASHDSVIWASSQAEAFMRHLHQGGEEVWLLGDSGYPQRPWLMTPISDAAPGSREELYTQRHVRARKCIERCFVLLKSRWRCLMKDQTLHYHPLMAKKITLACCVLHNIALNAHLPSPPEITDEDSDGELDAAANISQSSQSQSEIMQGRAMLNSMIAKLQ